MNRFLFPRWTNKFLPVLGLLLLAGAGYAGTLFLVATDDTTLNPGYQPTQPVPFSHKIHAGDLKMDCRYCHVSVDKAASASIPPTATCINCHSPEVDGQPPELAAVKHDSPNLRAVHESWASGDSIPWVRIHRLPDFVFFNHAAHVNRGVSCVECHGRIDTMEVVHQAKELSMAWCIECHDNPGPRLRPLEEVTNLSWDPADEGKTREEVGEEVLQMFEEMGNGVHPKTNCAVCHR